jgi:predicted nucleic acid-binding protein
MARGASKEVTEPKEPKETKPVPRYYWDACVFVSFVEATPGRVEIIEELLDDAEQKSCEIVTSFLSITEVSYAKAEKDGQALDPSVETMIDKLWHPDSPVKLAEVQQLTAYEARSLTRIAVERGWSLKPLDAIHLATAKRLRVTEFHTYDRKLPRWSEVLGFRICEPQKAQGNLFARLRTDDDTPYRDAET